MELTGRAVRVAVVRRLGQGVWPLAYAEAPLAPGVFVPFWERGNVRKSEVFRAAVSGALLAAGVPGARLGLALPDLTARLRIVPSDRPPTDRGGFRAYALERLQAEHPPSPSRIGPAFYFNGHPTHGYLAMLVTAEAAIVQIERLVRTAGAKPLRITTTASAIFDLVTGRPTLRDGQPGRPGVLVVGYPSATLLVTSHGAPIFARTFRHTWLSTPSWENVTAICAEVATSLDWCVEAGLELPDEILLAGEFAPLPSLAEALTQHVGIPCRLAGLPCRLLGRRAFPPQGIGALAAALW